MSPNLFDGLEQEKEEKSQPTFSYKEAADILNVNPSTVSHAVSDGKISTVNTGGKWDRIPASEVVQYGIKRGMDVQYLRDEVQKRTGASDDQFLMWIVIGLGVAWLVQEIMNG